MQIVFPGRQSVDEASESLVSILNFFQQRYGISIFRDMHLNINLMDKDGDDVELIDEATSQLYDVFEVQKGGRVVEFPRRGMHLKLVVDNTKYG